MEKESWRRERRKKKRKRKKSTRDCEDDDKEIVASNISLSVIKKNKLKRIGAVKGKGKSNISPPCLSHKCKMGNRSGRMVTPSRP